MSADGPLVVVDASVVVKWFLAEGETGVAEAAALLADHAEASVRLVAPALIVHELLGVFVRRLRGDAIPDAIEAFFDASVHLVLPDRSLVLRAAVLVAECQVSAFDAAYAALATSLGCELATADRRLENAVTGTVAVRRV